MKAFDKPVQYTNANADEVAYAVKHISKRTKLCLWLIQNVQLIPWKEYEVDGQGRERKDESITDYSFSTNYDDLRAYSTQGLLDLLGKTRTVGGGYFHYMEKKYVDAVQREIADFGFFPDDSVFEKHKLATITVLEYEIMRVELLQGYSEKSSEALKRKLNELFAMKRQ